MNEWSAERFSCVFDVMFPEKVYEKYRDRATA